MFDIEALVFALRCNATPGGECGKKEECPYFLRATEEEIAKFRKKYDPCGQYPIDFFDSCDRVFVMNRAERRAKAYQKAPTRSQFKTVMRDIKRNESDATDGLIAVTINLLAVAWHRHTGAYGNELSEIMQKCLALMHDCESFVALQDLARKEAGIYCYHTDGDNNDWHIMSESDLDSQGIEYDGRPHWEVGENGASRCSNCGATSRPTKYCGDCGCRMEEYQ